MPIAVRALVVVAVAAWCGSGLAATASRPAQIRATAVHRFEVPAELPDVQTPGTCEGSRAAWFRADARRCTAGTTIYDPCFVSASNRQLLCNVDPRKPGGRVIVTTSGPAVSQANPRVFAHRAWFFELADGTTCRPMSGPGRELEGFAELYSCQWGSDGLTDAVLGDLDDSHSTWTIRKVMINKKTDPQTIKSISMAVVKAVWE